MEQADLHNKHFLVSFRKKKKKEKEKEKKP